MESCSSLVPPEGLFQPLYNRFKQLGGIEYLEESITCWHQGLNLCPIGDPDRSMYLNNIGAAVAARFNQLGRMEDLEEAITCLVSHPDPMGIFIDMGYSNQ